MAEEKRFVLYEYLSFFWKKKWWFLIIPAATALILAGITFAINKGGQGYTGEATVFIGSVDRASLVDTDNIEAEFEDVKGLEVIRSSKEVTFRLERDTAKEAEKELTAITEKYAADLDKTAQVQIELTTNLRDELVVREAALQESFDAYNQGNAGSPSTIEELDQYSKLIVLRTQDELARLAERIYKLNSNLELFDLPKVLYVEVEQKKTYVPQAIAIGLILGLILTVAFLLLVKYIDYARSYYRSRGRLQD